MSRRALGKGINALLQPDTELDSVNNGTSITRINIGKIRSNPNQPRKAFNDEKLNELADSIREQGIIQPILVESIDDSFTIIAGERRFRAAGIAGLTDIPVIIRSFTREEKMEIALIENIQREDLNPIEEAKAYKQLIDEFELNQEKIAQKVGKKRSTIANSLRLLKLSDKMQKSLIRGEITAGHARSILAVVNPADQHILYSRIISAQLSVREAEAQVIDLNKGIRNIGGKEKKLPVKKIVELQGLEQKFIDAFGTKVNITGSMKKGKIEISYFSLDDLDRIYEIIVS